MNVFIWIKKNLAILVILNFILTSYLLLQNKKLRDTIIQLSKNESIYETKIESAKIGEVSIPLVYRINKITGETYEYNSARGNWRKLN